MGKGINKHKKKKIEKLCVAIIEIKLVKLMICSIMDYLTYRINKNNSKATNTLR